MKRRGFIGCAVAAVLASVSAAKPKPDEFKRWLCVAHLGTNLNGRRYTAEILRRAATQAPGLFVMRDEPLTGPVEVDLHRAVGQCVEAESNGETLICRFRWFGDTPPYSMHVTPCGEANAILHTPLGFDLVGKDYVLKSFALNKQSAFQRATAV